MQLHVQLVDTLRKEEIHVFEEIGGIMLTEELFVS